MDKERGITHMKNKLIVIVAVLAAVGCFVAGFQTAQYMQARQKANITVAAISEKIESCSDLTTASLEYNGLIKYTDGDIPFINKKSFSMIYQATIKAGLDLSKAEVSVSKSQVKVTLPEAQIQSVDVDTSTLQFYDEELALFNWTDKEDTAEAVNTAKEDAETNADTDELKSQAQKQAKKVLKSLLTSVVGSERELVIQ